MNVTYVSTLFSAEVLSGDPVQKSQQTTIFEEKGKWNRVQYPEKNLQ